jgi:hypothetical protein
MVLKIETLRITGIRALSLVLYSKVHTKDTTFPKPDVSALK